jgi:hypothetical protein
MVVTISFSFGVVAQEPDAQLASFLSGTLGDITTIVQKDSTGATLEAALEQRKVYDQIWLYLSNSNAGDGLGPNPERDRRVAVVERTLDQYQPALISAFHGQLQAGASSGRVFNVLEYSRASPALKATLKKLIASPAASSAAVVQAYDLMFRQQLEDAADKQSLIERVQMHLDRSTAADVAKELIGKAATVWALEDMMPLYREWLSLPYSKENVPKGRGMQSLANLYARASDGLMALGSKGADLLPLLSLRLDELNRADDEHSHNTATLLQQAIDVVAGKAMPRSCGNSKAKYLGASQVVIPVWKAAHKDANPKIYPSGDHPSSQSQPNGSIKSPPTPQAPDTKPAPTGEESTSSTPWAIVVVMIAAAMGLLWLVLKRSAK